jgi:hypothetical protein
MQPARRPEAGERLADSAKESAGSLREDSKPGDEGVPAAMGRHALAAERPASAVAACVGDGGERGGGERRRDSGPVDQQPTSTQRPRPVIPLSIS